MEVDWSNSVSDHRPSCSLSFFFWCKSSTWFYNLGLYHPSYALKNWCEIAFTALIFYVFWTCECLNLQVMHFYPNCFACNKLFPPAITILQTDGINDIVCVVAKYTEFLSIFFLLCRFVWGCREGRRKAMKSEDDPHEEFLCDIKCIYNAAVPIHFILYWLQLLEGEEWTNLYKKFHSNNFYLVSLPTTSILSVSKA